MQIIIDAFVASKKWVKILSVLMVILFILTGIGNIMNFKNLSTFLLQQIINCCFYIIPAVALLNYAKEVNKAEESHYPISHLEDACQQQAKYFKVLGITVLVFAVLSIIAMIGVAVMLPIYGAYLG